MPRRQASLVLVLLLAPLLVAAPPARADAIDDYIKVEMERRHIPGLALAVARNGKIVKVRGYGVANLEHDVPMTPDTVFERASVTKQFTATAIMLLVEEGKVQLDDPVAWHLPRRGRRGGQGPARRPRRLAPAARARDVEGHHGAASADAHVGTARRRRLQGAARRRPAGELHDGAAVRRGRERRTEVRRRRALPLQRRGLFRARNDHRGGQRAALPRLSRREILQAARYEVDLRDRPVADPQESGRRLHATRRPAHEHQARLADGARVALRRDVHREGSLGLGRGAGSRPRPPAPRPRRDGAPGWPGLRGEP